MFENLPKENEGVEIEYSVKEKEIAGYDSEINGDVEKGFTIENKHTPTTATTTTEATTSTTTTEPTTSSTTSTTATTRTSTTATTGTTSTTAPTTSGTKPVSSPTTTPKAPASTGERVEISIGVSLLLLAVAGMMLAVKKRHED